MTRRIWRLRADRRVEPVTPPWHHRVIPVVRTNAYESTQTPGLPRSTHTDTDTAMEMGGLSMAPGGPDLCRITPRASGAISTLELAATVA